MTTLPSPMMLHVTAQKIAYLPMEFVGNAYTERMREILSTFGHVVAHEGVKSWLRRVCKGQFWRYDILFVNWLENGFVNAKTGKIDWLATTKILCKTFFLVMSSRRTVFVRHNIYPHQTHPHARKQLQRLIDWYERLFQVVFIHSAAELTLDEKPQRKYLPHPLYRVEVNLPLQKSQLEIAFEHFFQQIPDHYFLVFGRIVPYKKIEELLEQFPPQLTLVVAGIPGDTGYIQYLRSLAKSNCYIYAEAIPERSAQLLVRQAQAVLITHAEKNVVVSGTFFYAMSVACPVVAIATPFLRWMAPRIGAPWLTICTDIPDMVSHLNSFESYGADCRQSAKLQGTLEKEFGDHVIRESIAQALMLESKYDN